MGNVKVQVKWRLSDLYGGEKNLRVVEFSSVKETEEVIDMMWNEPELADIDFDTRDDTTLIVPQEVVEILIAKELTFKESKLV